MGTGGTARYHWNFPICPTRVTIDLSVVRALQHDLPAAGDQQGFLYGKEIAGATHINGREAIASQDRAGVESALVNARRPPVGYYRIRDGRAFILSAEEIEIANELFRRPGAVLLLIERRGPAAAEATFFFWRGDAFVHNLPMPFPLDAERLAPSQSATLPARRATAGPKHRRKVAAVFAAATVFGLGVAAMATRMPSIPRRAHTPPPISRAAAAVELPRPGGELDFTWDPKAMPAATAGLLEIDDGGVRHTIPLDSEQLQSGSFSYAPVSSRVTVEMSTLQRDGRVLDVAVMVRGGANTPPAPVAPATAAPAPPPVAPRESAPVPIPAPPAPKRVVDTAPPPAPSASADRRLAAKPFHFVVRSAETAETPVVIDPPALEAPPVSAAVLPVAPVLRTHIPPPPVAAPSRFVASAGRLIWTGTLLRRGVVELDGRSASVGSISGALPGVPVSVTISPAEFEGDGLVVYTTDAARHQRVEPASAANGWNKVKWVWDPVRVSEISVLEPPNQSNGFNRLAFRNDARRTSMVWIDWKAR